MCHTTQQLNETKRRENTSPLGWMSGSVGLAHDP